MKQFYTLVVYNCNMVKLCKFENILSLFQFKRIKNYITIDW